MTQQMAHLMDDCQAEHVPVILYRCGRRPLPVCEWDGALGVGVGWCFEVVWPKRRVERDPAVGRGVDRS